MGIPLFCEKGIPLSESVMCKDSDKIHSPYLKKLGYLKVTCGMKLMDKGE